MLPSQSFNRTRKPKTAIPAEKPTRIRIRAKFDTHCSECKRQILKDEIIVYQFPDYFNDKFVWCRGCSIGVKGIEK